MRSNFKRIFMVLAVVIMLAMTSVLSVSAEEAAGTEGAEGTAGELSWINILELEYVETEYGFGDTWIEPDDGIVHMGYLENTPYQYGLLIEGVEKKFRISGTIEIVDINTDGDISGWNGLRIICGRTDFLNYNTISLYRNYGAQIVNHSAVGIGPLVSWPEGFVFEAGTIFNFELIRDGLHFTFKLNDTVMIDYTIAEEEDFFTEDAYDNIGFIAINMEYDISNLKVEVEGVAEENTPVMYLTRKGKKNGRNI